MRDGVPQSPARSMAQDRRQMAKWQMANDNVHCCVVICHPSFVTASSLRASHAIAAVEAAVAGAATDGQCAAVVASGRVALEVGKLAVLLAQTVGDGDLRDQR